MKMELNGNIETNILPGGFLMGRPWREEYNGGIYHVISRGNNKEYIFKESIDKGYFIKLLKEYSEAMGYRVYGYILMSNHYHVIIQIFDRMLQEIMHRINNNYSKYFNYKYNRIGHVFQGRYKAIQVQDERYMLKLLRYVHQNPVRAGMCKSIEEYKWSSDKYYRKNIKSFVNTSIIFDMLDKDRSGAIQKYIEFMDELEEENYSKIDIIGEEAYIILCSSRQAESVRKRLDEILIDTGITVDDYNLVKSGSRKRRLMEYKIKYVKAALEQCYTYNEIGKNINMTSSGIQYIKERYK
jgi:REP element-mobilizing transposase RayT